MRIYDSNYPLYFYHIWCEPLTCFFPRLKRFSKQWHTLNLNRLHIQFKYSFQWNNMQANIIGFEFISMFFDWTINDGVRYKHVENECECADTKTKMWQFNHQWAWIKRKTPIFIATFTDISLFRQSHNQMILTIFVVVVVVTAVEWSPLY